MFILKRFLLYLLPGLPPDFLFCFCDAFCSHLSIIAAISPPDKTKAVIFRTINTYIPIHLPKLYFGDIEIKYEDSTKFLGVTFTKHGNLT